MMSKFNRKYRLTIDMGDGESLIILPPLTVNFTVNRSTASSVNDMQISIHNLSKSVRDRIFADRFTKNLYRGIIFEGGYTELSTLFKGNIFTAFSTREGADIVTHITAVDGGFDMYNSRTSTTLAAGLSKKEIIDGLIAGFEKVTKGNTGDLEGVFSRPVVLDGNTFGLIKKYTDDKVFIDLEKVNILGNNEVLEGFVPLLTSDSGLLGTPQRHDAFLTINTLFEPGVIMGQVLGVQSDIQSIFDGQYKVLGVKHSGTISESIGGTCQSTFNLLVGTQLFGEYKVVK